MVKIKIIINYYSYIHINCYYNLLQYYCNMTVILFKYLSIYCHLFNSKKRVNYIQNQSDYSLKNAPEILIETHKKYFPDQLKEELKEV